MLACKWEAMKNYRNPISCLETNLKTLSFYCNFTILIKLILITVLLPCISFNCMFGGFPDSSVGKESTCTEADPGLIPGLGRSTGEGIGYPLQYSWASILAQLVKNLPTMQETPVWFLGWEDPLEKGKATQSSILAWRIPWIIQHGVIKSQTWLSDFCFRFKK